MTEHFTVYFRNANGVRAVKLPATEALQATRKHPWEWSLTRVFADPPEGFVAAEGEGGGLGRVQGASVRVDRTGTHAVKLLLAHVIVGIALYAAAAVLARAAGGARF